MSGLPWFLFLPDGSTYRGEVAVEVRFGSGRAQTDQFVLVEPALVDQPSIAAALGGDPEDRGTRALSALATAERSRRWFHEAVGWRRDEMRWPLGRRLRLEPHAVHRTTHGRRGKYFPSSGTIELDYLKADDGEESCFACLSHDLVVHEVAHGLLHASNGWRGADVETRAVSESLADLLALFSASRIREARDAARAESSDLRGSNLLVRFGEIPGEALPVRDASAAPAHLDEVDREEEYEVAAVLTAALCDTLADRLEQLEERTGVTGDPLETAVLELSRAAFAAIRRLPRERVQVAQAAREIREQAVPELAEHLTAAYTRRRIPWRPTDAEAAIAAAVDGGAADPTRVVSSALGVEVSGIVARDLSARERVRFPLAASTVLDLRLEGGDRQGTAAVAFDERGRCRSCHVALAS